MSSVTEPRLSYHHPWEESDGDTTPQKKSDGYTPTYNAAGDIAAPVNTTSPGRISEATSQADQIGANLEKVCGRLNNVVAEVFGHSRPRADYEQGRGGGRLGDMTEALNSLEHLVNEAAELTQLLEEL